MTTLIQAANHLQSQLAISQAPTQLQTDFTWPGDLSPIAWLDAQPVYPKSYWQSRDGREEVLVLGACRQFTQIQQAQASLLPEQRIWGCVAFDDTPGSGDFFLPVVELIRRDKQWQLCVNLIAETDSQAILSQIIWQGRPLAPMAGRIRQEVHTPNHHQWCHSVTRALSNMAHTELKKVVLARQTRLTLDGAVSGGQLLSHSQQHNSESFHFLFATGPEDAFVGSTPERLYRRRDCRVTTEAVAGTVRRGASFSEDHHLGEWLLNDSKNVHENQLVVDDIFAGLRRHSLTITVDPEPHLIVLRHLQHLRRRISAIVGPGVDDSVILGALQPTAAVAGLPRDTARAFLAEQGITRGRYSGAVGYISQRESQFCVAIRSAQLTDNTVDLFAGAGIVPGSDPEAEWQELDNKLTTMRQCLPYRHAHEHDDAIVGVC
ncbi:hypothetical protein BZG79_09825 [Salinivibrio sp. MA427]|uniref:isochorismate synthase n=1 Tax=unclassified Salinivibrio TaxID=2636825 RepID=UPI0009C80513|nr:MULTISPECIES: isochorismate synthase [unclassified Salinivibrio]NUY56361.1 isochorismate synthase [Salinivibrio sp. EAGSL]OOE93329.1 hypothetical protein BZG76_04840 [Salinivibrio sp. AR647]OOF11781.1 hypothetical protein BZG79_09825 [Salinivibrio sp. MA427]